MQFIILALVTALAVLGAYSLCEMLTDAALTPDGGQAIVILSDMEGACLSDTVHALRRYLPAAHIMAVPPVGSAAPMGLPNGVACVSAQQAVALARQHLLTKGQ